MRGSLVKFALLCALLTIAVPDGLAVGCPGDDGEPPPQRPQPNPLVSPLVSPLAGVPDLAPSDLPRWRAAIEPTPEEQRWLEIPWQASFGAGLREAARSDRPVLLWVMNGHPLGCT